jgi:hypothetical protein
VTPHQIETLRLIGEVPSRVCRKNMGYGAWRILGANPSTVGKLIANGLAAWGANNRVELTGAGRAALTAAGRKG